jgi:phosphoribosylamine---glycine ligase
MKVLVIGSGAREHAISWKVAQSSKLTKLFVAPGNPGMSQCASLINIAVDNIQGLLDFAVSEKIDLTIVGPELPLSLGIVDKFRTAGLKIFGPTQKAAQLESSKKFAKEVMIAAGVPTAKHESFTDPLKCKDYILKHGAPIVLKADGLASGKGVFVCLTEKDALDGLNSLVQELKAKTIVVEDFLTGKEVSYIIATNGKTIVPLASSHDYKRIYDNDEGPNTGGMGSVSPTPNLPANGEDIIIKKVIEPTLKQMEKMGTPFSGFLYAGLMISPSGELSVLEFNTRLGDPETQVIMRRMESDLLSILFDLAEPNSNIKVHLESSKKSAVCVVQASYGYPATSRNGDEILGLDEVEGVNDIVVFHAGTIINDQGKLVTNGGRVLSVTAVADSQEAARIKAYTACEKIRFVGQQYRSDIAK